MIVYANGMAQTNNAGWETLFNGKNLKGWTTKTHHYEVGDNYGDTFRVEDGMVKVRYDRYEGPFNDRFQTFILPCNIDSLASSIKELHTIP